MLFLVLFLEMKNIHTFHNAGEQAKLRCGNLMKIKMSPRMKVWKSETSCSGRRFIFHGPHEFEFHNISDSSQVLFNFQTKFSANDLLHFAACPSAFPVEDLMRSRVHSIRISFKTKLMQRYLVFRMLGPRDLEM